jgi:hypothetical protein
MVVVSPNVNFNESSTSHTTVNSRQDLDGLRNAFDIEGNTCVEEMSPWTSADAEGANEGTNEWESDGEILRPRVTEDEDVPNGPSPVVPPIPREPDVHACQHHCSEIEHLVDATGPPPTHKKRRLRAAVATESSIGNDHCASVGVTEIKGKIEENMRKCAYYEALLAAEDTHLHNEPMNIREAKERPDWLKWRAAMQEELDSLATQHLQESR